jgi:uncharacterized protein
MNYNIRPILVLAFICLFFVSCKNDDEGSTACQSDFDQQELFVNVADNLIIPGYQSMQIKINNLLDATNAFVGTPDQVALDNIRSVYSDAYLHFQKIAPYEFGPAETVFLRSSLNNFPTNTAEIEANISNNTADFDQPDKFDKGFPALDYLLYGVAENDEAILAKFANGDAYKNYLLALVNDMKARIDQTLFGWQSGYWITFTENTGTAAGSSLSLLVNCLNENFELIKRQKLGIPSGVLTLGFVNPTEVEAYYSGQSVALAVTALEATFGFYKGQQGVGLDDYLQKVNAMKGDESLDAVIQNQFNLMIEKTSALEDPLSQQIEEDATPVVEAYNEVTKQLVNIKTDMPSVLCISITYIDNPSDSD